MSTNAILADFAREQCTTELVDVFVPGETGLDLSKTLNAGLATKKFRTISDCVGMRAYVADVTAQMTKGRIGQGLKKIIDRVITLSWTPSPQEGGKFEISFFNGIAASNVPLPDIFLLKKDSLEPDTVSSFLSLFKSIPVDKRPKVIFDAEKNSAGSLDLLAYSKDSARVFLDSPGGLNKTDLETRTVDPGSFLKFYEANSLAACADVNLPTPNDEDPFSDMREHVVQVYLQVQAKKRLGLKFEALTQVREIQALLNRRMSSLSTDDQLWARQALFFFLLDDAYIEESSGVAIEKALAIANGLGEVRLKAHAGRMINLTAGISEFSSAELAESAETFAAQGDPMGHVFCLNNKLVNDSHLSGTGLDVGEGQELSDFCFRNTPYSDRLSTVCSTVGVNAMLLNDFAAAERSFELGESAPGLRLHHLTAQVNRLISQYVSDGGIEDEIVVDCCNSIISANLPRQLDYHHTYLLGNLEKLAKSKDAKGHVQKILKDERYLDYSDDVVESSSVIDFLIPVFRSVTDGKRYRGARGEFYERFGLLPINHFIWS